MPRLTRRDYLDMTGLIPPAPPVKCKVCNQIKSGAKWDYGYGWITPSHRGVGKNQDRFGFCNGSGQYGREQKWN